MLLTRKKVFSNLSRLIKSQRFYSEITKTTSDEIKSEKLSENSKKIEINFEKEKQQEKPKPKIEKINLIESSSSSPSIFNSFLKKLFILFGGIAVGVLIYFTTKYYLHSEMNLINNSLIELQEIKTMDDILKEEILEKENEIKNLQKKRNIARELPTEEISFEKFVIKRASNQWNSLLQQLKNQIEKSNLRKIKREELKIEKRILDEIQSKKPDITINQIKIKSIQKSD